MYCKIVLLCKWTNNKKINKIIIIHISQPYLKKQIPFKIMAGSNFCHCLSKIQPTLSLLAIHTNYLNTARTGSCTEIIYTGHPGFHRFTIWALTMGSLTLVFFLRAQPCFTIVIIWCKSSIKSPGGILFIWSMFDGRQGGGGGGAYLI